MNIKHFTFVDKHSVITTEASVITTEASVITTEAINQVGKIFMTHSHFQTILCEHNMNIILYTCASCMLALSYLST